jgi:hypothetical protein
MGVSHALERANHSNELRQALHRVTIQAATDERHIVIVGLCDADREIVTGRPNQGPQRLQGGGHVASFPPANRRGRDPRPPP